MMPCIWLVTECQNSHASTGQGHILDPPSDAVEGKFSKQYNSRVGQDVNTLKQYNL